ncbi:MAG: GHKL domain-containing protein [Clostridiales bacterium]|nr:GHKL domain-containing protein [Clostridiales bacterium]
MNITETISLFLEFIAFFTIFHFFLRSSFKPTKMEIVSCFIFCTLFPMVEDSFNYAWILGNIFYVAYALTYKEQRLIDRFLLYCLSYTTLGIFQLILIYLLSFFGIAFDATFMPIIGNTLTIILLICILGLTPFHKLYHFICKTAFIYKMLLINSYLVIAAVLLYMKIHTIDFYQNVAYFITITSLIIAFNSCILYYDQKLFIQRQQLISYQKNLPIYKALIDEIRASQHEFSNRIQNIEQLPYVCKDYDSICNALLKNTKSFKQPLRAYPLLQLNMPLLSATLYNLYTQANKQNITILFDISSPHIESNAPEYILADFISILTNNAIEASQSDDKIYIRISSTNQQIHFEIRNPIKQPLSTTALSQFFQKGFSTKHNKDNASHGLGLYYLSNEIALYNGSVGVDCIEYQDCYWVIFELNI